MPTTRDPATSYARAVVAGEIVAGRLVRLACERHERDLQTGPERGLQWSPKKAKDGLEFFSHIKLPEGNKPFVLSPWEEFIVGSLFGWLGADGFRRFRTAYVEAAKGNGKTPLAAGIGLKGLVADAEPSAEIYTAGVTRDQANYLLNDAVKLVQASPALLRRVEVNAHNLAALRTNSFMRPVSSEARSLDQKRVHMALIDEIHEHPSSLVVDKMRAGTKGRRQALIFEITNSGYDRHSVCWHHHEYSEKVLMGVLEDDSWFAYICQLDPCAKCHAEGKTQPSDNCPDCDDWRNEETWIKANPNLDVSVTRKYLREQVREAIGMPSKQNLVKRLNLCLWTEQAVRAIPMDKWDTCGRLANPVAWRKEALERFQGRTCFGGLDLGSVSDLTALGLLFQGYDDEPPFTILPFFWVPIGTAREREHKDRVPYLQWIREGFITGTSGIVEDSTDYDAVRKDIDALFEDYPMELLVVDRLFQGQQICTQLIGDGIRIEAFGQGFLSMAGPTRRFFEILQAEQLDHGNNPVLRWMATNMAVEGDAAGNQKPSKERSTEKIDGIVATIMCIGSAGAQVRDDEDWYTPGMLTN